MLGCILISALVCKVFSHLSSFRRITIAVRFTGAKYVTGSEYVIASIVRAFLHRFQRHVYRAIVGKLASWSLH